MPATIGTEHLLGPLLLLTQPHTTQSAFHVAAGVQLKKPLVGSQFGPIINDMGTSGDVAGDNWAGSLTVGTQRSHLVTTQKQMLQGPPLATGKDLPSTQALWNYFWDRAHPPPYCQQLLTEALTLLKPAAAPHQFQAILEALSDVPSRLSPFWRSGLWSHWRETFCKLLHIYTPVPVAGAGGIMGLKART